MWTKLLSELPDSLILNEIFPLLHPSDLLALAACNKPFHALAESDEVYWKGVLGEKLGDTLSLGSEDVWYERYIRSNPDTTLGRAGVLRAIFKALSDPMVYIWGKTDDCRLGPLGSSINYPDTDGVAAPRRQVIPGGRVTHLAAGKKYCVATNKLGDMLVWGTMNTLHMHLMDLFYHSAFAHPRRIEEMPMRLLLPVKFQQVKCGHYNCIALDQEGYIWSFTSWSHPFRINTPRFDETSPSTTILQLDCGRNFSCALTKSGEVYVWKPFGHPAYTSIREHILESVSQEGGTVRNERRHEIRCLGWDFPLSSIRLPDLPHEIPPLSIDRDSEAGYDILQLVKIAIRGESVVGLSNKGHVVTAPMDLWDTPGTEAWHNLPWFSFWQGQGRGEPDHLNPHLKTFVATDITAFDNRFAVWSKGCCVILMGSTEIPHKPTRLTFPAPVVSVELGRFHGAAITEDGKLFTFGANIFGSLGLGLYKDDTIDDPDRPPSEVQFADDDGRKMPDYYCLGAAAGSNHTGALIVDLTETIMNIMVPYPFFM